MDCAMLGGVCLVARVWEEEKGVLAAMLGDVSLLRDVGCWMSRRGGAIIVPRRGAAGVLSGLARL